jgi:hypothetical protein
LTPELNNQVCNALQQRRIPNLANIGSDAFRDRQTQTRPWTAEIANVIAVRRNAISRSDDNNETNGESLSMFSCTPADDETRAIRPVFVVSRDLRRLLDE